eukprot:534304_1
MSTTETSAKWISLTQPPGDRVNISSGMDGNNYIVIDYNVHCMDGMDGMDGIINGWKYNIDNDKWIKMDSLSSLWIENMSSSLSFSTAVDVQKQILFLLCCDHITQIQLNSGNIVNHNHEEIPHAASSRSIILNNSLFIIGGCDNNSILKWNSEKKTFTKFADMYNKINIGFFAMIYNHNNNCLL